MRILHISPVLPDATTPGGGSNYPYDLARAQAELGHDVEIWGAGTSPAWFRRIRQGRFTVCYERPITVRPFHRSDPLFLRLPLRMALGRAPDVVHFHQYKVLMWRALLPIARARRMKTCLTDLGGGGWRNLPVRFGHMVDRFLLLSHYNAPFFLKGHEDRFRTDHGLWPTDHNYPGTPDRIVVIGGGVDHRFYVPRPGPPDSPPYVLYVGRAMPHKGVDVVIQALGLLRDRHPSLLFKIAGPEKQSEYLDLLRQESRRLGIEERVIFLGYCSPEDLRRHYRGASLFVLASTHRPCDGRLLYKPELFGLVLLEAMACGVPVICSRVAGLTESVHDGETGLTFEDRDAAGLAACMDRLLTDQALRERLIANAHRLIEAEYTWARVAEKCISVYGQLLG